MKIHCMCIQTVECICLLEWSRAGLFYDRVIYFYFRRMNTFENDLFTTVDAILELLGQKPKYPHVTQTDDISMHPSAKSSDVSKVPKPRGARLIKTVNDLDRVFAKI